MADTLPHDPAAAALTPAEFLAARPALRAHAMDGLLLDGVPLAAIARDFATPSYVLAAGTLRARADLLAAAMAAPPGAPGQGIAIHYAVKANDSPAVLRLLAGCGFGADVVSGGELSRALAAGFPAGRIVFSGVGKTGEELRQALIAGIGQINVESAEELAELAAIATSLGAIAPVALRVNPDIDAGTHDKISTGREGDKFGIPYAHVAEVYARGSALPGISMRGLAAHIGSQIFAAQPFRAAYARLADLTRELRAAGHAVAVIDCGGGLGIPYADEPAVHPAAWAGAIRAELGDLGVELAIEPGRWLVGPAGVLLSRVIRVRREGLARPIIILDAAMNDLVRPAMYGAYHGVIPVLPHSLAAALESADIAGPVCESSDIFARARQIPKLAQGDLVALLDCGAYGAVMSSTYNARPLAAEVLVESGAARLIRRRQSLAEMDARDA